MTKSTLQLSRAYYHPKMPLALRGPVRVVRGEKTRSVANQAEIEARFPGTYGMPVITFEKSEGTLAIESPINVGVVLSGGQAPGGHSVIAGLFDRLQAAHKKSHLYGFIQGPGGLLTHKYKRLTIELIREYRNTGGFDILGSDRTKLETTKSFDRVLEILRELDIRALVVIGGDDSNTNACMLAEHYLTTEHRVQVIGCPKTIDGDLKNEHIEASFGFDTACKVYSELIGNIQRDCNSARKYWHFMRLMGRSASHIALECALQTHPNICIISEEVQARDETLDDIVDRIAGVIARRAEKGDNFGTVLIPEGLIEFIPTMKTLIDDLDNIVVGNEDKLRVMLKKEQRSFVLARLKGESRKWYLRLPEDVAFQLMKDRDAHGNIQVSLIETEKLLAERVGLKLAKWKEDKRYTGTFLPLTHFFGYEGRCAAPSNFDTNYCYSLGYTAANLILAGETGYMASIRNTTAPAGEWIAGGIPITMMMNMEKRNGKLKPVIQKALVKLDGAPFKALAAQRDSWIYTTDYLYPGPIQFFGPSEVRNATTMTLQLEQQK
jgi:pyrophosphate--fructose-6-phosphate 1-phosphotransferase